MQGGVASGVLAALIQKIPLDMVRKAWQTQGATGMQRFVKAFVKGALPESAEGFADTVAGNMADRVALGKEADTGKAQFWRDSLKQAVYAAAIGAVSGGVIAGVPAGFRGWGTRVAAGTRGQEGELSTANGTNSIGKGAGKANEGGGNSVELKLVPSTKEIRKKFDNEGLTQDKINQIVSSPKSQKPKPETYLSNKYIEEHKQSFKDSGVVKIMPTEPTGTIGGKGGTFVMSGEQLDNIIKSCKGDISKIEDALGFDRGYLGKNPVIVEIHKVSGLRLPRGNELGALPDYWLPGGYTTGGIKEAVVDPAPIGTYTFRHLFR